MNNLKLIDNIINIYDKNRVLIIGIDGLGGAGKSTISTEICDYLNQNGYDTKLLHIDDFIHDKSIRYDDNYTEWECYYNIQWRYDYLLNKIINPIKIHNEFNQDIELYDKENDTYILQNLKVSKGSILIIEGIFLQRKEINNIFDYIVYIDVPEDTRLNRVLIRDTYIGNYQQILNKYNNRYFRAEHEYIKEYHPYENADYLIKNID